MRNKTKEGLQFIAFLGLASLAAALPLAHDAAKARNPEGEDRVAKGAQAFGVYCASCHGLGGEGNGPMAEALKDRPADLTGIRERNGGAFPKDRLAAVIDGREAVLSHGPGSMPVWGLSFQDAGRDLDQEKEVRERIQDLVAFLESIQK
ncbi:MAG: c-type cytochrome, partial [Thermoanaerobaculia bacterium]